MSGKAELPQGDRFEEGKEHSHQAGDSKDQRSIANRLAAEERKDENAGDDKETALSKENPTLPVRLTHAQRHWNTYPYSMLTNPQAKAHGNAPSKGAKIDAEIQAEEEATLQKKGDGMPGKKN